jgi:beta-galactosidase
MHRLTTKWTWVFLATAISILGLGRRVQAAPAFIWLEGEKPDAANFPTKVWGGAEPQILSDGKWLTADGDKIKDKSAIPPGGLALKYGFEATDAGLYEVWMRVGYEFIRAPLEWSMDGGQWTKLPGTVQTTNLMEVALWCEVAWVKAGTANLGAGKHTLDIRYTEPGSSGRILIGLDCIAFIKGEGGFFPEGVLRPGQQYDEQIDKDAREKVFRFQADPANHGQDARATAGRIDLPLSGVWQVARYDDPDMDKDTYEPVKALPNPAECPLRWMGIQAPGDAGRRPELRFGHRLFYQTRVEVPASLKGRSLYLQFSGTCWIASVFVNDQYIGGHKSVLTPWDLDISRAVRPGAVNTIAIGIKSGWYALDPNNPGKAESLDHLRNMPRQGDFMRHRYFVDAIYPSSKGEGNGLDFGLVNPVKLVVTGPAYTSDIFIRTSVAGKRLDADVEIANTTAEALDLSVKCEAMNEKTRQAEKTFGPVDVKLAAGQNGKVAVGGAWENPNLWWPEDNPNLYVMRTTISRSGRTMDVHEQLFGFREVTIEGPHFLLNGIRWHFWNWVGVGKVADEKEWLEKYHAQNDRFQRFDSDGFFRDRENAFDFFDRNGIPGRLSTCIDGMFITHALPNPLVWENFQNHVRQVVKAYRNHPSIMMYSLENELMFIAARLRFRKEYEKWEQETDKLCKIAKELDPTRASFGDGAGDLGGLGEINCQHYSWPQGESLPAAAYAYPLRKEGEPASGPGRNKDLYLWDGKRPLALGEVFYYSGNVSAMAWIGGPDVYRGKSFADEAAGVYARMMVEGARWQGVTAICPWVVALPGAKVSFEPRAVFVREYNSCFQPGSVLEKTIKVFNDGRRQEPLTLKWKVVLDDKDAAAGEKTYKIEPGHDEQDVIKAKLTEAAERKDGRLELALFAAGKSVFQDSKPITMLPRPADVKGLNAKMLCVYDPEGSVAKWLSARQQPFTAMDSLTTLPVTAKVLVVGRNALPEKGRETIVQTLKNFVTAGNTAIVLAQDYPLAGSDLPAADIAVADPKKQRRDVSIRPEFEGARGESGRICFPVAPAHPVFAGLRPRDFFTWAGDEMTFRNSYSAPASGAISLVQAGEELRLSPMLELPLGQGSYLLSQMLIAEKLGVEPVADQLLHNALAWAAQRAGKKPGRTAVCLDGDPRLEALLKSVGVKYDLADSAQAALAQDKDIAIVRATAKNLGWLQKHRSAVQSFCADGKWVMLVGLNADGLKAFNDLVGFEHRIRPGRIEAVTLDARTDPLLLGLSDRDVNMVGEEFIAQWRNQRWVSDRVFTAVVDGRDIASFAQFASPDHTKLADGLTNDDFWRYIVYFKADGDSVSFKYDRPETFTGMNIWSNESYYFMKDIALVFDGNEKDAVSFTLEAKKDRQELKFAPRKAASVTIRIKSRYPGQSKQTLVGIDDVNLFRAMPKDFDQRVVMLTKPGGLVKYPIGKGGIVLNQIDYTSEDTPENVQKKISIYGNILRNMGASFEMVAGKKKVEARQSAKGAAKKR